MVPALPLGERDHGRNAPSKEGSTIPTLILNMGIKKGKGIVRPYNLKKYGEGSSGLKKEEATN